MRDFELRVERERERIFIEEKRYIFHKNLTYPIPHGTHIIEKINSLVKKK